MDGHGVSRWNSRRAVVLRLIRPAGVRAHDSQRRSERPWTAREWDDREALMESSGLARRAAARTNDGRNRIMSHSATSAMFLSPFAGFDRGRAG